MKEIVAVGITAHFLPVGNLHGKETDRRLLPEPEFRARLLILIVQRFPGSRLGCSDTY